MLVQFLCGSGRTTITVQKALQIQKAIRSEVFGRVEKWGKVNYAWCALCSLMFLVADSS
jgi:hypothetical protein